MKNPRHAALLAASLSLVLLAGCKESPQVLDKKAGEYQGKVDTRPWEGPAYKGDKAAWESDLRARSGNQNELRRVPD
jgi:uncharacterized lipoprotein